MQKHIFLLFWQTAMRYRARTWLAIIGASLTSFIGSFVGPFFIALLLGKLQAGGLTLDSTWPLIGLYALTQLYGEVIGWRLNLYFTWTMETAAQRDLNKRIFEALSKQSLTFHANRFGGALVSQTTKLTGSFERFWDTLIFQLVPTVTSIIGAITILSFIFWQYAIILTILTIVFTLTVFLSSRFLFKRNRAEAKASNAVNAYVADAVTNINAIKSHGKEDQELDVLTERAETWRQKSLATMRGFLLISTGYSGLIAMLNISVLIAAIWASEHAYISIAVVYLAITYTFTVARQLWEMNSIMRNYNRIMGDAHDMVEILLLEPTVKDTNSQLLNVSHGAVAIDNLQFTHDGSNEPLFENFSLAITAGERIGLVGRSGSGKTTITRLLLRFNDIEKGSITIDGQNIAEVTQKSLRQSIAYVPQEPMLFHRTLRENIAFGKSGATEAQIIDAAKQANAFDFIMQLPKGFDTLVGERGIKLSGGQRQRVAIARAIIKDAPILLLDEATSALDSESEGLIQDALTKLMKNRTSIVIAHRLSTISKLDRIIVLDNGKIIEQGSHTNLLSQHGVYAKLWSHQSGGFIEE
ncbi:ABC transporter ATP-binding protein [Pedobacter sp.]|nr:ABC transporter ATP-binding protein [Candidatus Saccharibacteria bacterium]